jgi:SAM-dependent methyltransferase
VDGIPVLLVPERLVPDGERFDVDLRAPQYAEAYEEMSYYNDVAKKQQAEVDASVMPGAIERATRQPPGEMWQFPHPRAVWLDEVHESVAQWEAYEYLAPLAGKCVLQTGGKGTQVIKFLVAGATEGWLISPMLTELAYARALAQQCGVADQLHCVAAVAEELPFPDGFFDAIYAGSCVHHMVASLAAAEFVRVLKPGGRFAAIDPWRAPLYAIGTKILGKREREVHCRPLTPDRVAPFKEAFREYELAHHGALTRYPLLALEKFRVPVTLAAAWKLMELDDRVCGRSRRVRSWGSCVSLRASK